ncbi:hypothetical protein TNCV_1306931 [Trichonephila clavipes]|nr:hypothetical protein TNCV_1306931 [Trichonephila clavipes]
MENGLTWGILEKGNDSIKRPTSYHLRPRLMYLPRQTKDLWNNSPGLFPKRKSVYHTRHQTACGSCVDYQTFHGLVHPSTYPPEQTTHQILLPDPPPELTTPQILLPDPPSKQTTPQILLTDPPVVETLEPTLTDDSSMDQIMSCVFGDCLQQGIPSADTQETSGAGHGAFLFDESNDLISFLDHFEAGLAIEQQEAPMDLTMPRMKRKVRNFWV